MIEPISDKHERNSAVRLKSLNQLAGFNQSEPDYNFIGWHRDRFAIKQEYVPNQVVQFDRNTTLYGKWQRKNCTLLFNPCGGLIEDDRDGDVGALEIKIVVERGKTITDIPVTKKDGYIFLGWYTDPDAGTIVTEDTIITDDAMLFARWQIDYDRFLQEIQGDIAAAIDDIDISVALDDEGEGGGEAQPKVELGPLMPPIPEGRDYGHYQIGGVVDGKTTLIINTDEGEKPVPVGYDTATFTLQPPGAGSLRTAWWASDNGGQLAGHERPPQAAMRHKVLDHGSW